MKEGGDKDCGQQPMPMEPRPCAWEVGSVIIRLTDEAEAQQDAPRPLRSKRRNLDLNLAVWFCL